MAPAPTARARRATVQTWPSLVAAKHRQAAVVAPTRGQVGWRAVQIEGGEHQRQQAHGQRLGQHRPVPQRDRERGGECQDHPGSHDPPPSSAHHAADRPSQEAPRQGGDHRLGSQECGGRAHQLDEQRRDRRARTRPEAGGPQRPGGDAQIYLRVVPDDGRPGPGLRQQVPGEGAPSGHGDCRCDPAPGGAGGCGGLVRGSRCDVATPTVHRPRHTGCRSVVRLVPFRPGGQPGDHSGSISKNCRTSPS